MGHRLCRVDDAAAADRKDKVHIRRQPLADRLTDKGDARVRLNASDNEEGKPLRGQILLDAREQPRAEHAAAAVENEDTARTERAQLLSGCMLRAPPEDDLRRAMIDKALHKESSSVSLRNDLHSLYQKNTKIK